MAISAPEILALTEIVKKSFSSVFEEFNMRTESWYQAKKLETVSRTKYADYIINRVGKFPLFGTSRVASVESSYVKIRISPEIEGERYRNSDEISDGLKRQKRGKEFNPSRKESARTLLEALESTNHGIALLGNAGSGKTTAFRHVAVQAALGQKIRGQRVLPLYLAIREITTPILLKAAGEFLEWLEIADGEAALHSLLRRGRVILLIDGLDETDKRRQVEIIKQLEEIRQRYQEVLICISSRPYSLAIGLPGFSKWETLPLAIEDRISFVEKWYAEVDPAKGERLLAECRKNSEILDIGSSPLMLSIVCALYFNDLKVPQEQDELYERAIEGLLGAWDAFRNIARSSPVAELSILRRKVLISWLAASMFEVGRLAFSVRDVENTQCLRRAADFIRMAAPPDAEDILKSMFNDFGILIERSPSVYSFSHLTLHEYLTARYIVDNRREFALLEHRNDQEWFEVVRLVAKMLPNAEEYMKKFTNETNLADPYQVSLLLASWTTRPICRREFSRTLMAAIAKQISTVASYLGGRSALTHEKLVIEVSRPSSSHASTSAKEVNKEVYAKRKIKASQEKMNNLPDILRLFSVLNFSFEQLECASKEPFLTLYRSNRSLISSIEVRVS